MDSIFKHLNSMHFSEVIEYFHQLDYCVDQAKRGVIGWRQIARIYRISIAFIVFYVTLYCLRLKPESIWFYLDAFQANGVNRFTGLMAAIAILNSCRFHYLLYFCNDIFVTRTIGKIVLKKEFDFFLKPYNRAIVEFPSFACCLWVILFIVRLGTGAVFFLSILFNTVKYFQESYHIADSTLWYRKTAELILLSISLLIYYCWLKPFVFYCLTLSYFAINMIVIIWIRLRQTRALLYKKKFHNLAQRMLKYSSLTRHLLLHLFQSNHVYGHALFIFLVMQSPISSYLIIEVLVGRTMYPFLFLMQLSEQIFAIMFLHMLFASVNDQYRRPNNRFYALLIRHQHHLPARIKLHLNFHFQIFKTKKRYGFSYGQFGVLSIFSFTKFLLFYSQLLIIVYKMIIKERILA